MKRGILPVALLLALLLEGSGSSRVTFDQENCSLCHIRESIFFDPSFLTPEDRKLFDEVRICGSCHNGSVQDSRAVLWKGAQHPVLPTGKGRERTCTACHSPHEKGGWGVLAGSGVSLRRGGNAVCAGCHPDQAAAGAMHAGRTGVVECRDCHAAHGGVGKSLLREAGGALCRQCHASIDSAGSGGHPLDVRGNGKGGGKPLPGCLGCHPVHRAGGEADRPPAVCVSCHRFEEGGGRENASGMSHPGKGTCITCHTFHATAGKDGRAFRGKDIRPGELCRKCHASQWAADVKAGRAGGTHVTVASAGGREICSRCHRMHESPGAPLLRSPKPYSCLDCHGAQNTIREEGGIALAHPIFEKVAKGRLAEAIREKRLLVGPLGEIVCRTCHKVHAAEKGTPLLSPGVEKAESCFLCHSAMRGKNHGGPTPGTVIRCLECHPVHGQKDSGTDPWRSLCRRCHPGISQHKEGGGDSKIGRESDLPGFDPRGRKSPFGAVSCPTCHDPHGGGEGPKRVRKPYRPDGILCTTCHRKEGTVVLTPHDLRGIAGESVCEPCHRPHGGESPWMWAPGRGNGESGEASCRSCHHGGQAKGPGLGRRLPLGGHPTNIMAPRPLPDRFPRIGPDGKSSRGGVISCPTCHDVHGSGIMPVGHGVGKLLRRPGNNESIDPGKAATCSECHKGKEKKHGPLDCLSCHPPHTDDAGVTNCRKCHPVEGGALFDRHRKAGASCGTCHKVHGTDAGGGTAEEPCLGCHPATRKIRKTSHASLGSNSCDRCHPVHRDPPGELARPKLGEEIFWPDVPCLKCHREGGAAPSPARRKHPARTREVPTNYGATVTHETPITMLGRFKEGVRPMFPLFDASGNRSLSGIMGCLTCHDPHAGGTRDGSPTANGYLRDPGYVFLSEICAPCHRGNNAERIRTFHKIPGGAH